MDHEDHSSVSDAPRSTLSVQDQLLEAMAQVERLSKELGEKTATIAAKDAALSEKDSLIVELTDRLDGRTRDYLETVNAGAELEDVIYLYGNNFNGDSATYLMLYEDDADVEDDTGEVHGDDTNEEEAAVEQDVLAVDEEKVAATGVAVADENVAVVEEKVAVEEEGCALATRIYDELFPVKPISVKSHAAGSFPLMADFTEPFTLLGHGANGLAFRSELAGRPVAVKVSRVRSAQANADDYYEWSVSEKLNPHPNVLQIAGLCPSFSHEQYPNAGITGIVTPLQENGTLEMFLEKGFDKTDEWQFTNLALGMIEGIKSLHDQGAIHRDIALRNFLVDGDGRVLLCDFGLTRFLSPGCERLENLPKRERLPWCWMAPESFLNMEFTAKSDIWMFGQTLLEIVTCGLPWKQIETPRHLREEMRSKMKIMCPGGHLLKSFISPANYFCDTCETITQIDDTMQSCRLCNYDLCSACVKLQSSMAPELANVPPIIAEVIRECLSSDPKLRPSAKELSERLWKWQFKEDLDTMEECGRTTLQQAVVSDNFAQVESLLATNRVAVNACDSEGKTALVLARSPEILTALLKHMPLPKENNSRNELTCYSHNITSINQENGESFINMAVRNGLLDCVVALSQCTADDIVSHINAQNNNGQTVLHVAAGVEGAKALSTLVETKGVHINARDKYESTPLHAAVLCNNIEACRVLLAQRDIEVNSVDNQGRTCLHLASENGYCAVLKALLAHRSVDVNAKIHSSLTALHFASSNGHTEIVSTLLACAEIKVNAQDQAGWTALHKAVSKGHAEIVSALLSCPQIEVNIQSSKGWTALHLATFAGHTGIVNALLVCPQIEVNTRDTYGCTALHISSSNGHAEIVSTLLSCPQIGMNLQDNEGWTALHKAASKGHAEIVSALLSCPQIDMNLQDDEGWTALHKAASKGHTEIVSALLCCPQIKVNTQSHKELTALHMAASGGHTEIVSILLACAQIEVNAQDHVGWTALHKAASNGHSVIVSSLLSCQQIKVNIQSWQELTPLHLATSAGHTGIVNALLACPQIEVNTQDRDGWTALHEATSSGQSEIVSSLLSCPQIEVNLRDKESWTALHRSASEGHTEVVSALLCCPQIEVNILSNKQRTALHKAASKGYVEVVSALLKFPQIDVHIHDKDGNTAFQTAAYLGHNKVVALLQTCDQT